MAVSQTWHAQKDFLRKTHNRRVNSYFRDVPATDDNLGVNTTRSAAKSACLIRPNDSQNMALLKIQTFLYVVQQVQHEPNCWGMPTQTFVDTQRHKSQIILHFRERYSEAYENDRMRVTAQVAFRVINENWTTVEVNQWATRIRAEFATPPFNFNKGRELFTYNDPENGWSFQLYVTGETEAKDVINRCFDVRNAGTPDWDEFLKDHNDRKNYTIPEYVRVMGDNIRKPRKRPRAKVYFTYAELLIPGLSKPITLVDVSGQRPGAVLVA